MPKQQHTQVRHPAHLLVSGYGAAHTRLAYEPTIGSCTQKTAKTASSKAKSHAPTASTLLLMRLLAVRSQPVLNEQLYGTPAAPATTHTTAKYKEHYPLTTML